jgi:hypothetical protein
MPASYDKPTAIVVMPPLGRGRVRDPKLRTWLAQSELVDLVRAPEPLSWILDQLGRPGPVDGQGALRIWGQTGDRPTTWIAAADPVYLEPRLDHLCVHVPSGLATSDLERLVDHLQQTVGEGSPYGFARVRGRVYLSSATPLATASEPPSTAEGHKPDAFLPDGLLRGYWASRKALSLPWPGDMAGCIDAAAGGFVAVAPATDEDGLAHWLGELRDAMSAGRLSAVNLLSRDGLLARVRRSHAARFWRRRHRLLDMTGSDA